MIEHIQFGQPCPFCGCRFGGAPDDPKLYFKEYDYPLRFTGEECRLSCPECNATVFGFSRNVVITQWNRRTYKDVLFVDPTSAPTTMEIPPDA